MIPIGKFWGETKSVPLIWNSWEKISEKSSTKHLNITSILNKFKSLIKEVYQKGWTHKIHKKKYQINYFRAEISQR